LFTYVVASKLFWNFLSRMHCVLEGIKKKQKENGERKWKMKQSKS